MLHAATLIFNFVIIDLLLHKNENLALHSTGGTAAAMCVLINIDCDYRVVVCVCVCHVTYSVV